jgi:hypothetical protein
VGYSYTVFAVDFEKLKQFRTGDQALYQHIAPKCKDAVESVAEYLEDGYEWASDDDGDSDGGIIGKVLSIFGKKKQEVEEPKTDIGDEAISGEEALRHLILGGDFVSYGGTAYGYLFEAVLGQIGKRLDADGWESLRSSSNWDGEIEKALNKSGIKLALDGMMIGRGAPIAFPHGDDFPYLGHFTPEECKLLASQFESLDTKKAGAYTVSPEYGEIALNTMRNWFKECSDKGLGLVTFYY